MMDSYLASVTTCSFLEHLLDHYAANLSALHEMGNNEDKLPSKGDTIKYIYTNSQHKNPLCRVASIDSTNVLDGKLDYDKEKYKEMILDAAETVLGYFGFDRNLYSDNKIISKRKWWLLEELRQERERDIKIETGENN